MEAAWSQTLRGSVNRSYPSRVSRMAIPGRGNNMMGGSTKGKHRGKEIHHTSGR